MLSLAGNHTHTHTLANPPPIIFLNTQQPTQQAAPHFGSKVKKVLQLHCEHLQMEVHVMERTKMYEDVKHPHTITLENCCFLQSTDIPNGRDYSK